MVQFLAPGKRNAQTSQIIKGQEQEIAEGMKILSGSWGAHQAPLGFYTHNNSDQIKPMGHKIKIKSYEYGKRTHTGG